MEQYVHTQSDDLNIKLMDASISRVFDSIFNNPLLRSPTIITSQVFTSGTDLVVSHKLNRPVTGYVLVNSTASANLYTSPTINPNPKQQIILRASANTTANILFY